VFPACETLGVGGLVLGAMSKLSEAMFAFVPALTVASLPVHASSDAGSHPSLHRWTRISAGLVATPGKKGARGWGMRAESADELTDETLDRPTRNLVP
jgi:hypothetical protein